jgi:hypothetical protein
LTIDRTFSIHSHHLIPYVAVEHFTRANTINGAPLTSMRVACSPWASTSNSTPTMNMRTIRANARTSRTISLVWRSIFTFPRRRNECRSQTTIRPYPIVAPPHHGGVVRCECRRLCHF